jgi:TonB family protein
MRTTVIDTRKRMLPGLLQQQYAEAKAAFERKDFAGASAGFKQVIDGLADPDIANVVNQPQLADLGTLATGFRDLAEKALMPPPPPQTAKAAVMLPAPVAAPSAPRVYSAADNDVSPPAVVRQVIPPFNRPVAQRKTAVVELLINERGGVDSALMVSPLDPSYDRAVVAAAKNWQYEPAKADGKPVKYQKRVQITLVPTTDR